MIIPTVLISALVECFNICKISLKSSPRDVYTLFYFKNTNFSDWMIGFRFMRCVCYTSSRCFVGIDFVRTLYFLTKQFLLK